jgi:uncharacterized membrane protein YcaP (DUF421 family)
MVRISRDDPLLPFFFILGIIAGIFLFFRWLAKQSERVRREEPGKKN